jgi:hypothetical protein
MSCDERNDETQDIGRAGFGHCQDYHMWSGDDSCIRLSSRAPRRGNYHNEVESRQRDEERRRVFTGETDLETNLLQFAIVCDISTMISTTIKLKLHGIKT